MGWARTLLLGDIGNRLDIGDAEEDIARLRKRLRASLGRLLVGKGILTTPELSGFAELIDETND